jgi:hypothetical protein
MSLTATWRIYGLLQSTPDKRIEIGNTIDGIALAPASLAIDKPDYLLTQFRRVIDASHQRWQVHRRRRPPITQPAQGQRRAERVTVGLHPNFIPSGANLGETSLGLMIIVILERPWVRDLFEKLLQLTRHWLNL